MYSVDDVEEWVKKHNQKLTTEKLQELENSEHQTRVDRLSSDLLVQEEVLEEADLLENQAGTS